MRIGIDACLLAVPLTGIGRYTTEMSRELIALGGEFFLYMPKPPIHGDWRQSNVHVRACNFRGRVGKMLWSQTLLPYQVAKDRVDVFWGATHRIPRYLPDSTARVVTIHDLVWKYAGETMRPLSRWVEQRLMPEAVSLADKIIADSSSTASAVAEEFPEAKDKVSVVHLGAMSMPAPADRASLLPFGIDRPYFLFVGTLEPRKNLRRLLGAFSRIPESIRAANLLVIAGGKGWGGVNVEQMLLEMGLTRHVVIMGYVSDGQLSTLYAHARFFAMPSLYEGFGLPLVEAMSCGAPVLTSNSSSLPEVAGEAGLLVNPLDEKSIADGLMRLLTDDACHANLAAKAKANAARFSWAKAARETMTIFAEALRERQMKRGKHAGV
jgi:glycosyltransferase involved in cell wall biosynthesis